ncbi:beta-1 adrenergic receptor-like [Neocloeon triangulifer]|uniref:beta-1 adrenergic receptor-like n=1 Tax=Neocloeon triangulifer TaxID=2078957 RepID=UPI00286F21D3|nr:beta-1 adrenergic receptor-like [Neocloeon triangulifer]
MELKDPTFWAKFCESVINVVLVTICALVVPIIVGNVMTVVAVFNKARLNTPSNIFIVGLVVADLLLTLSILLDAAIYATIQNEKDAITKLMGFAVANSQQELIKKQLKFDMFIHRAFLAVLVPIFASFAASACILVFFTLERHIAVAHGDAHRTSITKKKSVTAVLISFMLAALFTIPLFTWNQEQKDKIDRSCDQVYWHLIRTIGQGYYIIANLPLYVIIIILVLVVSSQLKNDCGKGMPEHVKSMEAVRLLLICFIILWLPFVLFIALVVNKILQVHSFLFFAFSMLAIVINCALRPIIYMRKMPYFGKAFRQLVCCNRKRVRYGSV